MGLLSDYLTDGTVFKSWSAQHYIYLQLCYTFLCSHTRARVNAWLSWVHALSSLKLVFATPPGVSANKITKSIKIYIFSKMDANSHRFTEVITKDCKNPLSETSSIMPKAWISWKLSKSEREAYENFPTQKVARILSWGWKTKWLLETAWKIYSHAIMICNNIFKTQFVGLTSLTTFWKVLVIHWVLKLNIQP